MASRGNQQCANCIGTLSFPIFYASPPVLRAAAAFGFRRVRPFVCASPGLPLTSNSV